MSGKDDALYRIVSNMDATTLRTVIYRMSERLGPDESLEIVTDLAESVAGYACEDVYERALDALYMEDRRWYAIATTDEDGNYCDSMDHAYEVILGSVHDEFDDDLANILEVCPEEAPAFLREIARAIRDSDSILFSENEDLKRGFPRHIERCIEEGEYGNALDLRYRPTGAVRNGIPGRWADEGRDVRPEGVTVNAVNNLTTDIFKNIK